MGCCLGRARRPFTEKTRGGARRHRLSKEMDRIHKKPDRFPHGNLHSLRARVASDIGQSPPIGCSLDALGERQMVTGLALLGGILRVGCVCEEPRTRRTKEFIQRLEPIDLLSNGRSAGLPDGVFTSWMVKAVGKIAAMPYENSFFGNVWADRSAWSRIRYSRRSLRQTLWR